MAGEWPKQLATGTLLHRSPDGETFVLTGLTAPEDDAAHDQLVVASAPLDSKRAAFLVENDAQTTTRAVEQALDSNWLDANDVRVGIPSGSSEAVEHAVQVGAAAIVFYATKSS